MSTTLDTDICIIGGGIAGLWLNARLRQAGYQSLLVERGALGGGQSVKSQGSGIPCTKVPRQRTGVESGGGLSNFE